ncbi:hypothetical protein B0H63DRAFT_14834 [Podospora didyma]|uniref:Secreted protein n=1 Tax=Podospora didyma TaxID=330526 RepID=A0AAE0U6X9_9PEZI|nr:hypothetical protein B0H63DRAFT_14834 [Podospora didyma]
MVSFNFIFAVAAAFAGTLPVVLGTELVEADTIDILDYTPEVSKRHPVEKDPYAGWYCKKPYPTQWVNPNPSCNANNCYRAFLNARKGSDGFHCPSVAFGYCCQWYSLSYKEKYYVTEKGILYKYLPWTDNCGADGPFKKPGDVKEVIEKIDDVCACTLKHKVRVTLPNDYAALNLLKPNNPVCKQKIKN